MSQLPQPDSESVTQRLLAQANAGDEASREQLFRHCCDRLERLARKMLSDFPSVRRWEQTDDVFQNAAMRLMRALREVKPESVRHFYALAATQIRRELIDLARHYGGANGAPASFESRNRNSTNDERDEFEPGELTNAPDRLASWTELHEHIANLPDEEREVCELLWYQGLTQPEAAELLGMPLRTLKRRWQAVRLKLHDVMNGQLF
jgi:RNA polymerase sigma factor (sigma-70 family)